MGGCLDPIPPIEDVAGSESLLKPFISKYDTDLINMGLCQKATADAVLACLKSRWGSAWMWECIEWRVAALRYERKWETWYDESKEPVT